jgi:hypothetical protein
MRKDENFTQYNKLLWAVTHSAGKECVNIGCPRALLKYENMRV